jgi:hypothetical protein
MEPIKKAEQKKEAQQSLNLIFAQIEKADIVEETTDYKRLVCPACHKPSLFYDKHSGKYECLNNRTCGLNSTIRLLTQKSR